MLYQYVPPHLAGSLLQQHHGSGNWRSHLQSHWTTVNIFSDSASTNTAPQAALPPLQPAGRLGDPRHPPEAEEVVQTDATLQPPVSQHWEKSAFFKISSSQGDGRKIIPTNLDSQPASAEESGLLPDIRGGERRHHVGNQSKVCTMTSPVNMMKIIIFQTSFIYKMV